MLNRVCSLLLLGLAALCLVEVPLRYGFGGGIGFYDELAGFGLVWLTFLGAVLARRDGAHIGIRNLVRSLRPGLRKSVRLVEHSLMVVLHLVILWFGGVLALRFTTERAITMPLPMGLFYLVLPLSAALTLSIEIRSLLSVWRGSEPA